MMGRREDRVSMIRRMDDAINGPFGGKSMNDKVQQRRHREKIRRIDERRRQLESMALEQEQEDADEQL